MSSLTGIVRNRAWPSTESWFCGIALISNPVNSPRGTINLRLGAVRRLAYEAADCGLLSADLAAGIRRVKGVKKLGIRLGNWLTAEQGHALWRAPDRQRLKGKRDRALLALLLACGLRRHEAVALTLDHLPCSWSCFLDEVMVERLPSLPSGVDCLPWRIQNSSAPVFFKAR
jgi:integrase